MLKRLLTTTVLSLLLSTSAHAATNNNEGNPTDRQSTMIVLDGSNSMWGQLQGINKIVTARDSLKTLLENAHGSINFGLLTYGDKNKKSCNDFTLVSKPEEYDMVSLLKNIYRMNPKGRSPIADALKKAASTLPRENAHILLVSDGEESCGGDPCAVARELREANPSLQIDVIGFRAEKEAQLECIAENGNGAIVVADNTERLKTLLAGVQAKAQMIQTVDNLPLKQSIGDKKLPGSLDITLKPIGSEPLPRANYSIYTLDGQNVASFTSRTQVKEYLKPGSYRVKAAWQGRSEEQTVEIQPGQNTRIQFDSGITGLLIIQSLNNKQQPVEVNYSIYSKDGEFISRHILHSDLETRIPEGEYRIKADYNGTTRETFVTVRAGTKNQHAFKFIEK